MFSKKIFQATVVGMKNIFADKKISTMRKRTHWNNTSTIVPSNKDPALVYGLDLTNKVNKTRKQNLVTLMNLLSFKPGTIQN